MVRMPHLLNGCDSRGRVTIVPRTSLASKSKDKGVIEQAACEESVYKIVESSEGKVSYQANIIRLQS